MSKNTISRFLNRAEDYDKYRPRYPIALIEHLRHTVPLSPGAAVADIAAGTGIFTELLTHWDNPIYVVEPNEEMMIKAKSRLRGKANCEFISGIAESTGLSAGSIQLILAAQAFHWFDPQKTKAEFIRIGSAHAYVGIIWNKRQTGTPFEQGYESLLQTYGTDYLKVSHSAVGQSEIDSFFFPGQAELSIFPHTDWLTYEAARGRVASYSFMPKPTSGAFAKVERALHHLFEREQQDGLVSLSYESRLYLGPLRHS